MTFKLNPITGQFNYYQTTLTKKGSVAPTDGAGVAAEEGELYSDVSNESLWMKNGPLDTDWIVLIAGGGVGVDSINGQAQANQTLTTGTSGSDFGITSSSGIHTINLPVASATNTGKLSSTDWSTFNAKQNAITVTSTSSVLLQKTGDDIQAYVKYSVNPADAGNVKINLNTETDGVRAQVPNTTIRGLLSAADGITYNSTTGEIGLGGQPLTFYYPVVYTLTLTDIANKYVLLPNTPNNPGATKLTVFGGPEQLYGVSFIIDTILGSPAISWDGYSLEALLEAGDVILAVYN